MSINSLKEKYFNLLYDICMIETPTPNKKNIDKMADYLEKFAKNEGYETERFPFEKAGDFLLVKSGANLPGKPVLLMAHMDTVHKEGAFGKEVLKRDGDILSGPGVMDCKGGIPIGFCVMELLKENCGRPIYFLLTSDEEMSGRFSGQEGYKIIMDTAKSCEAVFNLEPGVGGKITVGRKGILKLRVEIAGFATHAGQAYFEGASAIREAANMILEIESKSKKDGITYNCGIISGGTGANVVPDYCTMEVDIRVRSLEEMEFAEKQMQELAEKSVVKGTKRKVSVLTKRPPMEVTDDNLELLKKWNDSAKVLGYCEYEATKRGGGSDAAYTVIAGVPTLCSCAMVGSGAHTLDESVDLSTFNERVEIMCDVIKKL